MIRINKGLGIALLSLFFLSLATAATTPYGGSYFYLAPNGDDNNDGRTINTPVKTFWRSQSLLGPGDILLVRGGTYNDQLFVTTSDGTPDRPITVQAYPGEKPIVGGHSGWGAYVIAVRPYYIFDGLNFEGMLDGNYVFWVHDTHHITLRNISMKNFANDMVLFAGCTDIVVENSTFDTAGSPLNTGTGEHIWIAGSSRVLVQNSKFIRAGHASISIIDDNRNGGRSSNNVIRNNVIEQHWSGGIYIGNYSRANLIEGNQISYTGENAPYTKLAIGLSCPENIVRKNVISRSGSSLQALDNGIGVYAWDDGGKIQDAIDNRFYNNIVYRSANRGLYFYLRGVSQATRNKFVNNVFYHNKEQNCDDYGCGKGWEISVDSYHTANKWASFPNANYFFNNVILGSVDGVDQPGGQVFGYDYEGWVKSVKQLQTDYPAFFKGNLDVNPKFVNPDGGNFTLQQSSPLVDAGSDLTVTVGSGSKVTQVSVEDARFFTDGYGVVPGDAIRIGANDPVAVTKVDAASNTLTVARPVTYNAGEPVNLLFAGAKPDIGAFEYGQSYMSATAGTPQIATVETAFGAALQVKITDSALNPVAGVMVTFTAPASGAGATFNGSQTVSVVTDSSGIATTPVPSANANAGAYVVSAAAVGYPTVTFSLTNNTTVSAGDFTFYGNTNVAENFYNDGRSVELGVRFRSDVSGFVKGIRFFKNGGDKGPHTGSLWSSSGALLATGTFTGESPSGWQLLTFASPVLITANTTYVASYHTTTGFYYTWDYFLAHGSDNPPLHALRSGVDGVNGLYYYSSATVFPSLSYRNSNYWVDVIFVPAGSGGSDSPQPKAMAVISGTPQSVVAGKAFTDTLSVKVTDAKSNPVAGLIVTFSAPAAGASATMNGSASVAAATDSNGVASVSAVANAIAGTYSVTVSVAGLTPGAFVLTNNPAPTPSVPDNTLYGSSTPTGAVFYDVAYQVELGVKFRSDVAGYVKGVRFYKGATDGGPHTGSLWSTDGTLLATGTFVNETATGWQELQFASPVAIAANKTYIASYHTNTGHYYTWNFFRRQSVDAAPLHALRAGEDGDNGVYGLGNGTTFPDSSYLETNYWVDVIFTTVAPPRGGQKK